MSNNVIAYRLQNTKKKRRKERKAEEKEEMFITRSKIKLA